MGICFGCVMKSKKELLVEPPTNFFSLETTDIYFNKIHFSDYLKPKAQHQTKQTGSKPPIMPDAPAKLFLIVNVASACGLTGSNYSQLKKMNTELSSQGLHMMGFPCNQFFGQENKCEADIEKVLESKFKVNFQIFSKIEVNGENCHPVYKYIRKNSELHDQKTGKSQEIPWNFAKFLVDRQGKVLKFYSPNTKPDTFKGEIKSMLDKIK